MTTEQRLKFAGLLGALAAGSAYLFVLDPAGSILYPPCIFHAMTGLHCPGCGTLRAMHQLLHLNIAAAFSLNPLALLSLPFLGYAFASYAVYGMRGRRLPSVFVPPVLIWTLLAVILSFWILRNIQWHPFSLLAPLQ
jgi:hypothetical protein